MIDQIGEPGIVIGVDCLPVRDEEGGAHTFLFQTLDALVERVARDQRVRRIVLFTTRETKSVGRRYGALDQVRIEGCGLRSTKRTAIIWSQQISLPAAMRRHEVDVLWTPAEFPPFRGRVPTVTTWHGALALHHVRSRNPVFRAALPGSVRAFYRLLLPIAAHNATRIVTVSEFMAREITSAYPTLDHAPAVIYEGAPALSINDQRPRGRPKTVLFIGNSYPYKGHRMAIDAFAKATVANGVRARLRFIGREMAAGNFADLRRHAERLGIEALVDFLPAQSEPELARSMQEAHVLLFPSLAESFGLPPLEAMAAGLPVIASDQMAIPEISGPGAVICPAGDVDAWAEALHRLLTDDAYWSARQQAGTDHVRRFTWAATASALLDVLVDAAGAARPA